MSERKDFDITKAGKLKKYTGKEENVVVPDEVVEITSNAFGNVAGGPVCITLPEGLKKISFNAFLDCRNLVSINIPDSVTHIGASAFSRCENLKSVTIPKSIQKIEDAFWDCKALGSIIVPDDAAIKEKCWNAFSPTSKIKYCLTNIKRGISLSPTESAYLKKNFATAVQIATSTHDVEALAASFSTKKKVALDVLDQVLLECANDEEICAFVLDYKSKNYSAVSVEACYEDQQNVELGIRQRSVSEWRKIFKFPAYAKEGKMTIDGYKSSDEKVVIPGKIGEYPVSAISYSAFKKMAKITEVVIEEGVSEIGDDAFQRCVGLERVALPNSVSYIGWGAFAGCISLTEISLPAGVTEISNCTFEQCTSLREIKIHDGVTSIGERVFYCCSALQNVSIPASVTSIGFVTFAGCKSLTIHAPAGSYAETYAKENNIPFVAE